MTQEARPPSPGDPSGFPAAPAAVPAPAAPAAVPANPAPFPGGPLPGPVPPPPREAWRPPRRVEMVPGTPFAVVHLDVPPVISGQAVGSLVAGISSIIVALLVGCFGVTGADAGWGGWAAGAFAVLGVLTGAAGVVLGVLGRRQVRRTAPPPAVRFTGHGLAVAGLSCGAVGLGLTVAGFTVGLLLALS